MNYFLTGQKRKDENGFTLIETLVSLLILGILVTLTMIMLNKIYANPKILLGREALRLAEAELTYCVNNTSLNDTIYTNERQNLKVKRKITDEGKLAKVEIAVVMNGNNKEILRLETKYVKWRIDN